jgi:mono/diheme cytochrome c family protein
VGRLQQQKATEQRRKMTLASLSAAFVLATVGLAFAAGATGYLIGKATGGGEAAAPEPGETTPATGEGGGGTEAGAAVFEEAGCGGCHTFTPAGSDGEIGPNLDTTALDEAALLEVITNGRNTMPAFAGQLDEQQLADVAAFVAQGAGG